MGTGETVKGEGFEMLGHEPAEPKEQPEEGAAPAGEPTAEYRLDVESVLQAAIMQFAAVAWQKMGLQADPFTNRVEKDIAQARLAIDAVSALTELMKPSLGERDAREHQVLLTDLRLNFVRQSGGEG